jgi:hypothetical protein
MCHIKLKISFFVTSLFWAGKGTAIFRIYNSMAYFFSDETWEITRQHDLEPLDGCLLGRCLGVGTTLSHSNT